ncbi:MAG: hypothetical protein JOZ57_14435, partial [Abitibacteriaceae bacterium]|nr:hypothetical protein [Abditibacteriaceae bacterium]
MQENRFIRKKSTVAAFATFGTLLATVPTVALAQAAAPAPAAVVAAPAVAAPATTAPAGAATTAPSATLAIPVPAVAIDAAATAATTQAAGDATATTTTEVTAAPTARLYVELRDSSLADALEMVFKAAGIPAALIDQSAQAVNIESMTFTNAPWDSVARQLANNYGFRLRRNEAGTYIVEPRPELMQQNGYGSSGGYPGSGGSYPGSGGSGGYGGGSGGYGSGGYGSGGYGG